VCVGSARAAILLASLLWIVSGHALRAPAAEAASDDPFVSLFDGQTLAGWYGRPGMAPGKYEETSEQQRAAWAEETAAHWSVEDGVIVNDGQGPYLTTKEEFGDYELLIDYKTVPGADSGIYLRGVPQVQIWDSTDESKFKLGADKGSGALWNNAPGSKGKDPLVKADKPFGQWNSLRILHVGEMVSVWLNGKMVVDHARMANYWDRESPLPASGPIQLQTHGGEIRWRNIKIREIPPAEANAILAKASGEGFACIFDGQSLTGWQGATADYEVVDGAIQCKPGRGGNLYTEQEYGDFVVRLQFRLPPGGNNGLAIRYPGAGNPAYDAMTELQVLDNTAAKYARLDPRQYHGSAYGMAAAARGYLRPTGTWNYQEVTVRGSRIQVDLNGTRILDADLAEITDYMADSPHPGKDRRSGYFGFAGHSDPVAFRAVEIKSLD
jgi:hypothetical protein